MTAGAPWSVKGIDPKAREVAKDLARRSGMTLGEWLNHVILEDDVPEEVTSEQQISEHSARLAAEPPRLRLAASTPAAQISRGEDFGRVAYALDRLTDRIEASETRTGLAISGVEHSVRQAVARIEAAEREHIAVAARFETAVDRVGSEQVSLAERLRRMEGEVAGPRSAEALRTLEQSVGRLANHVYDGEARTQAALAALEARQNRDGTGLDANAVMEQVVARLGGRLAEAETRTRQAVEGLRSAFASLDARVAATERGSATGAEQRLEQLAASLSERVDAARSEIAAKLAATDAGRVDERLSDLTAQVAAAEQRSAEAIQKMGLEVLGMAEALNKRLTASEQRSAEAIAQVGGEMARVAGAVEQRLGRAEQAQAEALEKLGAEIGRITERLSDRMLASERRAAQAIDDVGEQVARVTERIEQRHLRASDDLAERIRQSEERTAQMLEEARRKLELRLAGAVAEPPAEPSSAVFGPELFSRAETADDLPLSEPPSFGPDHFESDAFEAEVFEPGRFEAGRFEPEDFAPIPEPEEDLFGLDQPEPPAGEEVDSATPLSTREVIEQARAAARSAKPAPAAAPVRTKAKASWRTSGKASAGLFGGMKAGRGPSSTLQTALVVAGVAAFMSVGAAGVMLIEGPPTSPSAGSFSLGSLASLGEPPRAAVALSPTPLNAPAETPAPALTARSPAPASSAYAGTDEQIKAYTAVVKGVESSQPGALAQLKSMADGGYAPAQAYLANLYEHGYAGVTVNLRAARLWMGRAAQNGDPNAMHNVALYEFHGLGGPQDLAGAAHWFRRAAALGVRDSQFNLALLYLSGSGVERNPAEAYKWFLVAAQGGDPEAQAAAREVQAKLSPAQIAAAQQAAQAFQPAGADAAQATASAAGVSETPPKMTLTEARRILGRLGYLDAHGHAAPVRLKTAIAAYQRDQGLSATGALDVATIQRLSVFAR